MKVGHFEGTNVIGMYRGQLAGRPASQGGRNGTSSDRADISQKGKDLHAVMGALKSLPDTRADLVARLRHQVATATYKVDSTKVVDGMLAEHKLYQEAGKAR